MEKYPEVKEETIRTAAFESSREPDEKFILEIQLAQAKLDETIEKRRDSSTIDHLTTAPT